MIFSLNHLFKINVLKLFITGCCGNFILFRVTAVRLRNYNTL